MTSETTHAIHMQLDANKRALAAPHGVARGVVHGLAGERGGLAAGAFSRYKSAITYQEAFAHEHAFCTNKLGDTYSGTGGRKIEFEIEPTEHLGDLIDSLYLVTRWPGIDESLMPDSVDAALVAYVWGLGYQCFQHVDLDIGTAVRLRVTSTFLEFMSEVRPSDPLVTNPTPNTRTPTPMLAELLAPPGQRMREMTFKWDRVSWHNMAARSRGEITLYTRLPFFFTESPGSALPFNAIHPGKIKLTVQMRDLEDCVAVVPQTLQAWSAPPRAVPKNVDYNSVKVDLLVGWVSLPTEEGQFMAASKHTYLVRQIYSPMGNVTETPIPFAEGSDTLVLHQNSMRQSVTGMYFAIADANRGSLAPSDPVSLGSMVPFKGGVRSNLGEVMASDNLTTLEDGCQGQVTTATVCVPKPDRVLVTELGDASTNGLLDWGAGVVPTYKVQPALNTQAHVKSLEIAVDRALAVGGDLATFPDISLFFAKTSRVVQDGVVNIVDQALWTKGPSVASSSTNRDYAHSFSQAEALLWNKGAGVSEEEESLLIIVAPDDWAAADVEPVQLRDVVVHIEDLYANMSRPLDWGYIPFTGATNTPTPADGKVTFPLVLTHNHNKSVHTHVTIGAGGTINDSGAPVSATVTVKFGDTAVGSITTSGSEAVSTTIISVDGLQETVLTLEPISPAVTLVAGVCNVETYQIINAPGGSRATKITTGAGRVRPLPDYYGDSADDWNYSVESFTFRALNLTSNAQSLYTKYAIQVKSSVDQFEPFYLQKDGAQYVLDVTQLDATTDGGGAVVSYDLASLVVEGLTPPPDFAEHFSPGRIPLWCYMHPVDDGGSEIPDPTSWMLGFDEANVLLESVHECDNIKQVNHRFTADVAKFRADRGSGPWLPRNLYDYRMADDAGAPVEPLKTLQIRVNGEKLWEDPLPGAQLRNLSMYETYQHPEVRQGMYALPFESSSRRGNALRGVINMAAFRLKEFEIVASRKSTRANPLQLLVWMEHWIVLTLSEGAMRETTYKGSPPVRDPADHRRRIVPGDVDVSMLLTPP